MKGLHVLPDGDYSLANPFGKAPAGTTNWLDISNVRIEALDRLYPGGHITMARCAQLPNHPQLEVNTNCLMLSLAQFRDLDMITGLNAVPVSMTIDEYNHWVNLINYYHSCEPK